MESVARPYDLSTELAALHANNALKQADNRDWSECLDQLYRASHVGGQPYWELYRWLADQLDTRPQQVCFAWLVPEWNRGQLASA